MQAPGRRIDEGTIVNHPLLCSATVRIAMDRAKKGMKGSTISAVLNPRTLIPGDAF
jgi:hypothetical protein